MSLGQVDNTDCGDKILMVALITTVLTARDMGVVKAMGST